MEKILVIGANGQTGRHIVNILNLNERYKVKVMLRNKNQKENFAKNVEISIGDLEKDFNHAFETVDKVIFAAGSGSSTGDDKTIAIDQEGAKKAVNYALLHHIQKFVMLSSMGTDTPNSIKGLETYLEAKKEADEYLKSKSLNYSILKPGSLTNKAAKHKIKKIDGISEGSISREDVAHVLTKCLFSGICKNKSLAFVSGNEDIDSVLDKV